MVGKPGGDDLPGDFVGLDGEDDVGVDRPDDGGVLLVELDGEDWIRSAAPPPSKYFILTPTMP